MKFVMTVLCSFAFAIAGICLAIQSNSSGSGYNQNAIHASTVTIPKLPQLPLDLQLDMEKKYSKTDTVYLPTDTVYVTKTRWVKPKVRSAHTRESASIRQNLRNPAVEPDPIVKNKVCGDREEYSPDTIGPPKESIILVVDGEEVYKR